jgi:hypothetical protein
VQDDIEGRKRSVKESTGMQADNKKRDKNKTDTRPFWEINKKKLVFTSEE